jgi:hypothetical protein
MKRLPTFFYYYDTEKKEIFSTQSTKEQPEQKLFIGSLKGNQNPYIIGNSGLYICRELYGKCQIFHEIETFVKSWSSTAKL